MEKVPLHGLYRSRLKWEGHLVRLENAGIIVTPLSVLLWDPNVEVSMSVCIRFIFSYFLSESRVISITQPPQELSTESSITMT